ncbi:unnamed protein product [Arctia plantaginis]|uniref:Las1-like protein n=1 Tax=Arctia plantaginis TaxID=874455 RepID=A0A8S1B3X6_ARCPL|nr:unnamed protein product [Arctia plantaginis]CAB3253632.1 unnamed protein product [Arctia plantaginis]
MSEFCRVVPWYNSDEWQKVYEELSDSSSNKENALNILLVWKARCPSLPSGIESTLSLLQVHVEDIQHNENVNNDQLLRLAYSSAIMRFVNHMLDTETIKGSSLYQAAKNLGVPDWIVDLRHDTAHSNNLPLITLLREACTISLQWLQHNYWDKYKPNITDCVSSKKEVASEDVNKISMLINLYASLSICAHPNCKIKNLSEIPNTEMSESIANDTEDLFGDRVDLTNVKTMSIMSLINILNLESKNLLKIPDVSTHVNEAVLGEDSLFMSRELLYFFSANDFKHKNRLNNSYMQCFEVLLKFLHKNDLLLKFILDLVKITQNCEQHFKARLAALWLSEILLALKRCNEFSLKIKKMSVDDKQSRNKKDLTKLYHHWFPSPKKNNLMLDLQKAVPRELQDINYIQPIIAAYNPFLVYFIRNLLNLIDPSIPNSVAERVYKLAEVISTPEKFPSPANVIYTEDDLKSVNEDLVNSEEITEDIQLTEKCVPKSVRDSQVINGIWRLASKNHNWSSCPIGQLPWQQKHYNHEALNS